MAPPRAGWELIVEKNYRYEISSNPVTHDFAATAAVHRAFRG